MQVLQSTIAPALTLNRLCSGNVHMTVAACHSIQRRGRLDRRRRRALADGGYATTPEPDTGQYHQQNQQTFHSACPSTTSMTKREPT